MPRSKSRVQLPSPAPKSSSFIVPSLAARVYAVRGLKASSIGRGTQVVRERSAKPLCVGSIPTRASINSVAMLPTALGHLSWDTILLRLIHAVLTQVGLTSHCPNQSSVAALLTALGHLSWIAIPLYLMHAAYLRQALWPSHFYGFGLFRG